MNNQNEYLKRKLKSLYKWYTKEKIDGVATITDIMNFFNTKIILEKQNDYIIENIDFDKLKVQVKDIKTDSTYNLEYVFNIDMLNYNEEHILIKKTITTPNSQMEITETINKQPIKEKITFTLDNNILSIERYYPNTITSLKKQFQTVVKLKENLNYKKRTDQILKLSKFYSVREKNNCFLQNHAYEFHSDKNHSEEHDRYVHLKNNTIIYGILRRMFDNNVSLSGVCIENTNVVNIREYLPYRMNLTELDNLKEKSLSSAIIFYGYDDLFRQHEIEIYKTKEGISITYDSCLNKGLKEKKRILVHDILPSFYKYSLTETEIDSIIHYLSKEDNNFIKAVIHELYSFKNEMLIKKGLIKEQLEILSPKQLILTPLEQIEKIISLNKKQYFLELEKQYNDELKITTVKEKTKVLK